MPFATLNAAGLLLVSSGAARATRGTVGASAISTNGFGTVAAVRARARPHSWLGDRTGGHPGAGYGFARFTPSLLLAPSPAQKTIRIGTRRELASHTAPQVQYDGTDIAAGSPSPLINLQRALHTGGNLERFSVARDFGF